MEGAWLQDIGALEEISQDESARALLRGLGLPFADERRESE